VARLIALGAVSLALGLALTPLVRRFALRTGTLDRPGALKRHTEPVPYLGGVAVLGAMAPGIVMARPAIAIPLVAATTLGVLDDRSPLSPWVRLVGEVVVGIAIAALVPTPLGGPAGWLLVVLATVVLINGVNLLDGIDGLATGVGAVAALSLAFLLRGAGRELAVTLAFALVAFLVFNWAPARIYLGDGGAYLIGACLTALVASAWHAPAAGRWHAPTVVAALCAVGVPAAELAFAVVRRVRGRSSLTQGDRRHPYDLLAASGWSVPAAAGAYIVAEAVVAVPAVVLAHRSAGPVIVWAVVCAIGLVAAAARIGSLSAPSSP